MGDLLNQATQAKPQPMGMRTDKMPVGNGTTGGASRKRRRKKPELDEGVSGMMLDELYPVESR